MPIVDLKDTGIEQFDSIFYFLAGGETTYAHQTDKPDFNLAINNFKAKGNTPVDFTGDLNSKSIPMGIFKKCIQIGKNASKTNDICHTCHLTINGIEISQFNVGVRMNNVVNSVVGDTSVVKNIKITNCFSNGMEIAGSIVTFENLFFEACGAMGIEAIPEKSNEAGYNFEGPQTLTFIGAFKANTNNNQTKYFQAYKLGVGELTIPDVINMLVAGLISPNDTISDELKAYLTMNAATTLDFELEEKVLKFQTTHYVALMMNHPTR